MELSELPQRLKLILFALRKEGAEHGFTDEWIAKALNVEPNQLDEMIGREEAKYDEITDFREMMDQQ